jgi:phosphatidylglycerophosphatase C
MKNLALFNLDGTLTQKDTMAEFFEYAISKKIIKSGGFFHSKQALALKVGMIKRDEYDRRLMMHYFKDVDEKKFYAIANEFSRIELPKLVVAKALERLAWHRKYKHEIAIVTSAIEEVVAPWAKQNNYHLIASQLEVVDGKLTGNFLKAPNRGFEKVSRIQATFDLAVYDRVYTYVDSSDDAAMLRLGDEGYMNWTLSQGIPPPKSRANANVR